MQEDIRWIQRFNNFIKAFTRIREIVQEKSLFQLSEIEQEGLIQRFEYTHELAWNTIKDFLEDQGELNISGSKVATRRANKIRLIDDGGIWMNMIQSRNASVHTYNQETALEIAELIYNEYYKQFEKFFIKMQEEVKNQINK